MNWTFRYKGFLVCPEAWARRSDGRVMWFGAITLSKGSQAHSITLDDELFDWPSNARRYAGEYAKRLIDAYVKRSTAAPDPLRIATSARQTTIRRAFEASFHSLALPASRAERVAPEQRIVVGCGMGRDPAAERNRWLECSG